MSVISISGVELQVGVPTPWNVYDEAGALVLNVGQVVETEDQLAPLRNLKLYRRIATANTPDSPFVILSHVEKRLAVLLENIAQQESGNHQAKLDRVVTDVLALAKHHADPVLGTLLYEFEQPYILRHPLLCAVVAYLVARRANLPHKFDRALIAAALVSNVGMLYLHETLAWQQTPLTPEQQAAIKEHPLRSTKLLFVGGLKDPLLTLLVMRHHERPDGSGYPNGLRDDAVPPQVRVLGLADLYAAMILPRGQRQGVHVQQVLRDLMLNRGENVDRQLVEYLIKEMGPYPVGSLAKLANGDTAIVTRRNHEDIVHPAVSTVRNAQGQLLAEPLPRSRRNDPKYAIVASLPQQDLRFSTALIFDA